MAAIRSSPDASRAVRSGGDPRRVLDALRAASPEVRAAYDAYVELHGHRIASGFELTDRTTLELPHTILASIVARLDGEARDLGPERDVVARLRDRVPAGDRAEFDEALVDAQQMYGLRDADVGPWKAYLGILLRREDPAAVPG